MSIPKHLLIPLDGSEASGWVIPRLKYLLEQPEISVTLLGVVETSDRQAEDLSFQTDPRHRALHDYLAEVKEDLVQRSIATHAEIRFGDPATEILREIQDGGHDFVAMSTHGRSGLDRILFGSVALKVLSASPAPLLLFRPFLRPDETLSPVETREPARFKRVLVPLDGSEAAEEILPAAEALARAFGSKLYLFMATPGGAQEHEHRHAAEEYLHRWQKILGGHDLVASIEVRTGPAAEEALAAIRERSLDVVALTTHGRTGMARALYGSVAEKLLHKGGVPVMLLRNRRLRAPLPAPFEGHRQLRVS